MLGSFLAVVSVSWEVKIIWMPAVFQVARDSTYSTITANWTYSQQFKYGFNTRIWHILMKVCHLRFAPLFLFPPRIAHTRDCTVHNISTFPFPSTFSFSRHDIMMATQDQQSSERKQGSFIIHHKNSSQAQSKGIILDFQWTSWIGREMYGGKRPNKGRGFWASKHLKGGFKRVWNVLFVCIEGFCLEFSDSVVVVDANFH